MVLPEPGGGRDQHAAAVREASHARDWKSSSSKGYCWRNVPSGPVRVRALAAARAYRSDGDPGASSAPAGGLPAVEVMA